MHDGFIKIAAGTPSVAVADVCANSASIRALIEHADASGANLLVLPELCITGSTCADLFHSETLITAAKHTLSDLADFTKGKYPVVIVGLPMRFGFRLFNCAAILYNGRILGIVPKTFLNAADRGVFESAAVSGSIELDGNAVPFGPSLIFCCENLPDFSFGVEIGSDLWAAEPPSASLCRAGASVIAVPCASAETVGERDYRRLLAQSASARLHAGYVLAGAGAGESTQDMVFSGHCLMSENGVILSENPPFGNNDLIFSEMDVQRLCIERRLNPAFSAPVPVGTIFFRQDMRTTPLTRFVAKSPFLPADASWIPERAEEILRIQSNGLKKRVEHTHVKTLVVGISGGLDSCLALLVMARTMDLLGRDRSDILAVSMPCFGTTRRTRSNAEKLCDELGVSFREICIADSVRSHFADIGHDESVHDVTYENSQARERTQVLMDLANETNGMVVGTGDLSELALGWATYNGDHMSMYGVNGGVPKTLIRHIVRYEANRFGGALADVLLDILDTPVSPELLPADDKGEIAQKTEDLVGPYELHDFFLYYALRYQYSPKKIYRLAQYALGDEYSNEVILKWLRTFFRRFFIQQFKRSCLPDGPKVGSVSISPRGDWRMPTDACSTLWLKEIDSLTP